MRNSNYLFLYMLLIFIINACSNDLETTMPNETHAIENGIQLYSSDALQKPNLFFEMIILTRSPHGLFTFKHQEEWEDHSNSFNIKALEMIGKMLKLAIIQTYI